MADTPNEAPAAPAESVATPNTNPTQPQDTQTQAPSQPDMHGFTSEQLADMKKFFDNNGGFDAIKSKISNPAPAPAPAPAEEQKPVESAQPASAPQEPEYKAPAGSITRDEYFTKRYFLDLAGEEKYAGIAKEIASGEVLKEMASLGIRAVNQDGSINASVVNEFLDLKAKTVPAKQSSAMPEAAAAPTVDYVPVGEKIMDMNQAMQVIRQDTQLKNQGLAGHPSIKLAEEFMKQALNKKEK